MDNIYWQYQREKFRSHVLECDGDFTSKQISLQNLLCAFPLPQYQTSTGDSRQIQILSFFLVFYLLRLIIIMSPQIPDLLLYLGKAQSWSLLILSVLYLTGYLCQLSPACFLNLIFTFDDIFHDNQKDGCTGQQICCHLIIDPRKGIQFCHNPKSKITLKGSFFNVNNIPILKDVGLLTQGKLILLTGKQLPNYYFPNLFKHIYNFGIAFKNILKLQLIPIQCFCSVESLSLTSERKLIQHFNLMNVSIHPFVLTIPKQ